LVLVNGRIAPELSRLPAGAGVRAGGLAAALREGGSGLEQHLAHYAEPADSSLVALNTAFLADGAYIHIPRRCVLEEPVQVVHVSVPGELPMAVHPRTLVLVEQEAQVSIVESYLGWGGAYLTNAVTELVVREHAVVRHYKVTREAPGTFHLGTLQIHQEGQTDVLSHCLTLGGGLLRHNIGSALTGAGGHCRLLGLYLAGGDQHVDNHLRVEHVAPHCDSREVFKGILDGQARAVFTGRIVVHRGAQKTDAKQTNKNLMLSGTAQVNTKPQLEIHADDVKCTHGATIGQIDREALFYLRSRGMAEAAARSLLVYAFAGESLSEIAHEPLRRRLGQELAARLPQGGLFEALP
jgi:Fe-S cluster assembly protein SufD